MPAAKPPIGPKPKAPPKPKAAAKPKVQPKPPAPPPVDPAGLLLAWYDRDRRLLPWRAAPGEVADPYRVWLSEVMLQQTTVAAVIPYFQAFLARWPSVEALAAAPVEDVMQAWSGLGYYARARNLHACAKMVAEWRGGRFPDDEADLARLPGIGEYTAAAIAAIAFGRPAVVVDGNVERVMARLYAVTQPLPAAKPRLKALAAALTPADRPGDYAQAVMDLGATLCSPRSPACALCPWRDQCAGRRQGIEADLPARLAKPERPTRRGIAFWVLDGDGAVLLRRRPPEGLLGGMVEIPSTEWRADPWTLAEAVPAAPLPSERLSSGWRLLPGVVRHTFTHFHLDITVAAARCHGSPAVRGHWCPLDQLAEQALPTLMRKLARHALAKAY
jgi:A/G-specific adenine glycosylase